MGKLYILLICRRLVNEAGLTRQYTQYEESPYDRRCAADADCRPVDGSPGALWCDTGRRRCAAMVEPRGDCTGMTDSACRCPVDTTPLCAGTRRRRTCFCQT